MRSIVSPSQLIRKLLSESPSTIAELAALTGWSKARTHSVLTRLRSRKQVEAEGFVNSDVEHGPKSLKLYRLTRYGVYLLRLTNHSLYLQRKLDIRGMSIRSTALLN